MTKNTGYVDYRITYISVFIHFVKVKVNYARVQQNKKSVIILQQNTQKKINFNM